MIRADPNVLVHLSGKFQISNQTIMELDLGTQRIVLGNPDASPWALQFVWRVSFLTKHLPVNSKATSAQCRLQSSLA
jgi:hypothetical protein